MTEILDPRLKYLQGKKKRELEVMGGDGMFGLEVERVDRRIEPSLKVFVQYDGDVELLKSAGLEVRTVAGDVVSGVIHMENVSTLASVEGVVRIESSRPLARELDASVPEINASAVHLGPPGFRGSGVIIGIIDTGIDITHESFRQAGGQSRILSIWDQSLTPQAGESNPAGFSYGVEYSKADIDSALSAPDPTAVVRHVDRSTVSGHGTHVAGIAAGDGSASPANTFVGVAPEAQIIMVSNIVTTQSFGDSTQTLDAVDYIFQKANLLDMPVVINLSQGDNIGPHDGTSMLERGIDNLLGGKGNIMVKSAGNEGDRNRHAMGTVAAGGNENIELSAVMNDRFDNIVDIWYDGADRFGFSITPPGGAATAVVNPGNTTSLNLPNGNELFVDSTLNDPNNGDNRIYVTVGRGTASFIENGIWTITLTGQTVSNGGFHAWIERSNEPTFTFRRPHRTNSHTISIPGTSHEVIAVGSYITTGTGVGNLSTFSSRGPTRDDRPKPEISAPGEWITSARAKGISQGSGNYHAIRGTSMAAPHVAGVIALMLQKNNNLTQQQVRDCLMDHARNDAFTGAVPNNNWGAGKVDAQAAVNCVKAKTLIKVFDDLMPPIVKSPPQDVITLALLDRPGTPLKFIDDPGTPFKFIDDPGTPNKFIDDPGTPLKFIDDPITPNKFADDPGTGRKFFDDPGTPNKFADDPGTSKILDDPNTPVKFVDDPSTGTPQKLFDDVKQPGLDKQPLTDRGAKPPGADQQVNPNTGRPLAGGSREEAAPFVMSTPHHSTAWMQSVAPELEQALGQYQQMIQQLEAAMMQYQAQAEAGSLSDAEQSQLAEMAQTYQSLLAEYQQVLQSAGLV